jgi:hypothetical protein
MHYSHMFGVKIQLTSKNVYYIATYGINEFHWHWHLGYVPVQNPSSQSPPLHNVESKGGQLSILTRPSDASFSL